MNRKLIPYLATHVAALSVGFFIAKNSVAKEEKISAPKLSQVSSHRAASRNQNDDGKDLLKAFIEQSDIADRTYEELKKSLPVTSDLKQAFVDAFAAYNDKNISFFEKEKRSAMADVRLLHWLRADGKSALDFLQKSHVTWTSLDWHEPNKTRDHQHSPICDYIREKGVIPSIPEFAKNTYYYDDLNKIALEEIKNGGGMSSYLAIKKALQNQHMQLLSSDDTFSETFIESAAKTFQEKDRALLLNYLQNNKNPNDASLLVNSFAQTSPENFAWAKSLKGQHAVDESVYGMLDYTQNYIESLFSKDDLQKRVQLLKKPNQSVEDTYKEIVRNDVKEFLNGDTDWCYCFRNGTASVEEIIKAAKEKYASSSGDGEKYFYNYLYKNLAEENPEKALQVLEGMNEKDRREILFDSTWNNFARIDPNIFLRAMQLLPEPITPQEKDYRTKGWNWKARWLFNDLGEDYVTWVKQMPDGIDKDTAMYSLVWATRERNPAKARELEKQLYPNKK